MSTGPRVPSYLPQPIKDKLRNSNEGTKESPNESPQEARMLGVSQASRENLRNVPLYVPQQLRDKLRDSNQQTTTSPAKDQRQPPKTVVLSFVDDSPQEAQVTTPPVSLNPPNPTLVNNTTNNPSPASAPAPRTISLSLADLDVTTSNDTSSQEDWETMSHQLEDLSVTPAHASPTKSLPRGRGGSKFKDNNSFKRSGQDENPTFEAYIKTSDHILEIYDLNTSVTTSDLERVFENFKAFGFRIKWVNDTSALAIFKSAPFAQHALESLVDYKLRPLSSGSPEAKALSMACAVKGYGRDQIPRENAAPRPYKTNTAVANRLIGNALQAWA